MPNLQKIVQVFIILIVSLTAGCTNSVSPVQGHLLDPGQTASEKPIAIESTTKLSNLVQESGQETMQVTIYHATNDAKYLIPEIHVVPLNDHPAQTAIELLLSGTKNTALVSVIPPGTKLRKIWIKDHIAYVSFNDNLLKKGTGGSTSELLLVGAIVNTLTVFPNIHKVQILVEGKKVDTIFGHIDTGEPLSRLEKMIKK